MKKIIEIIKKKKSFYDVIDDNETFFKQIKTYKDLIKEMRGINYHDLKIEFFMTKMFYEDLNDLKLEIEFLSDLGIKNISVNKDFVLNRFNFDLVLEGNKESIYHSFFEKKCSRFKKSRYKGTDDLDFLIIIDGSEETKSFFVMMFDKLYELKEKEETEKTNKRIIERSINKIINNSLIIKENDFKNYKDLLFTKRNKNEQ